MGPRVAGWAGVPMPDDAPRCKATTASGTPCQKRLYRSSDGEFWPHAGGHWFMADDVHACLSDDHYDPVSVLTHGPLVHLDVPCTRVLPPAKGDA